MPGLHIYARVRNRFPISKRRQNQSTM